MTATDSWTHRAARFLVRPLVDTPITPNQITTLRLIIGLAACFALAIGDRSWAIWGGVLWVVTLFLDRVDGELARLSGKTSKWGHDFDFACDVGLLALFFIGSGIGLRDGWLGWWAIPMGFVSGLSAASCTLLAERYLRREGPGGQLYPGFAGFIFDDIQYLFAAVIWLAWLPYFLVGTTVGTPVFAYLTWRRLR